MSKTFEDLSECKCSRTRAEKCRLPSFTNITSVHYNLHTKGYQPYACVATQRQHLCKCKCKCRVPPRVRLVVRGDVNSHCFSKRGSNEPLKLPKIKRLIAAIAHAKSSLFEVLAATSFHISHSRE